MPAPALAATSPVEGLRRRRLGFLEVLAQSVAVLAPTAALVTVPALVAAAGGVLTVPAFAAAGALVVLVAWSVRHAARRMAAVGGVYSYCARGLGPVTGVVCGWALVVAYAALAVSSCTGAALYAAALLGWADEPAAVALGVVVVGAGVGLVAARGVQLSARLVLALEAVSLTLVLVLLGVLLLGGGPRAGAAEPAGAVLVDAVPTAGGAALALLLAVTAFMGFESSSVLGVESRRPLLFVPRAVLWTPALGGVVLLLGAAAQVVLLREAPLAVLLSGAPLDGLVRAEAGGLLPSLLDAAAAAAFVACTSGAVTALVRVLFSMGREGVLPSALGEARDRTGTPVRALLAALPPVVLVPVVVLLTGAPPRAVLSGAVTVAAFGSLLAYALVSAAAPALLHRIGELTRPALVGGVVASASCAVLLVGAAVAGPWAGGQSMALVFAALLVPGLVRLVWLRRRHPERLARAGVYDEPTRRSLLRTGT
ncbi:APC family permease [Streptomyces sp. NP160]|uniref:APC family permease n=1 Tax=Streptomyces sp. NP160 TaxID=2586637 RepID=UPI0015D6078F|nr:APC family permease [Streptomyces sp. NP160]